MKRRVLLIGATGTFGRRLAGLLAGQSEIELVLAGRTRRSLDALRRDLASPNPIDTRTIDRAAPGDLGAPWLVIDAAGPFQTTSYALPQAAIRCGAHYVDLADARTFVAGFAAALDAEAKAAAVLAVTGASSTPALSQAALTSLTHGWQRLDDVRVAISPGARAPRGLSVIEAILSYVGQPLRVFRGGRWTQTHGWSGLRRLDMPGLGRRFASICDTPDLDLLPTRFDVRREALFLAGLELPLMHLGLACLALPVRFKLVRSLRPLAKPVKIAADWLAPLGTDRGGMIVEASGLDATGQACRARWALWAEANAGPTTPAAPAAALVRALVGGRLCETGACACVGLLGVDDILRELAHLPIRTRVDVVLPDDPILFRRLLGPRFDALPQAVRSVHGTTRPRVHEGSARARAGRGPGARLLRVLLGLPGTGRHVAEVTIAPSTNDEIWTRRFGSRSFSSRFTDTARIGVFEEGFGPLHFAFDLQAIATGVRWRLMGWRLGPLALPFALAPKIKAAADEVGGCYRFSVVVAHPWLGLLFAYRGTLAPSASDRGTEPQ